MKKILPFLLSVFACINLTAQSSFIQNIYARKSLNLNGRWHYIIDPYETGFRGFQGAKADDNANLSGFLKINNSNPNLN